MEEMVDRKMMSEKTIKIVITGAESTGKSVLSEALANHFKAIWIPELARGYVENLQRHYTYDDIELIARKQIETEQNIASGTPLVFFDTWLIISKVWFEFVFGKSPEWLHHHITSSKIDLFLICAIDIPWEADPVRENGGETRKILHQTYLNELEKYGFPYRVVTGLGATRTQTAIEHVNDFLLSVGSK